MAHNNDLLQKLGNCAAACEECLDSCLDEDKIEMLVGCIRSDRDCALICRTAAAMVASNSEFTDSILTLCEEVCETCAEECDKHEHDHCKRCAEACRECAEACRDYTS